MVVGGGLEPWGVVVGVEGAMVCLLLLLIIACVLDVPGTGRKISRTQKSVRWARSTYRYSRVSLLVPGLLGVYSNRLLSM
eukprot:scaffold114797_cov51-Attheya_sp.AAC.14